MAKRITHKEDAWFFGQHDGTVAGKSCQPLCEKRSLIQLRREFVNLVE
jgi:hypothetical protein